MLLLFVWLIIHGAISGNKNDTSQKFDLGNRKGNRENGGKRKGGGVSRRVKGGRRLKEREGEAERDREKGRGGGERKWGMGRGKERKQETPN